MVTDIDKLKKEKEAIEAKLAALNDKLNKPEVGAVYATSHGEAEVVELYKEEGISKARLNLKHWKRGTYDAVPTPEAETNTCSTSVLKFTQWRDEYIADQQGISSRGQRKGQ